MRRITGSLVGSLAGGAIGASIVPLLRPLFSVPAGGVGFVTVHQYPKGQDYAAVVILIGASFAGALVGGWRGRDDELAPVPLPNRRRVWLGSLIVFLAMLFVHDHPYAIPDPFHDGEHLTPAFLLKEGARPYRDVFFLHGFAADGGLDALVLGDPPSPRRARRLQTLLDAATLALVVPIAAEIARTSWGAAAATLASLFGMAAGQLPIFPYYRLAPVLLAAVGVLRFLRTGGSASLALALCSATLGVLWSLEVGLYAVAGGIGSFFVARIFQAQARPPAAGRLTIVAAIAVLLPLFVLVVTRADIRQFAVDSFVTIPRAIDAVWALPAPPGPTLREAWKWIASESARYYLPLVFFGFALALSVSAWRKGDRLRAAQIATVALFSIFLFRTAAGRVSWSHTRFGTALFGAAAVAFLLEPLIVKRKRVGAALVAVVLILLLEVWPNIAAGAKFIAGWRARQSHAGLVPYPVRTGKGIYTTEANARELAALNGWIAANAAPDATILDVSGERSIYYFLERKPPLRCPDIFMLSNPVLAAEARRQLETNPPAIVIVRGTHGAGEFDGLTYHVRVPWLAQWIDEHYPRRIEMGRYVVATK